MASGESSAARGAGITLDEARAALERYARTTWWRRRGLAHRLPVESHRAPGAHHVVFESFVEYRKTHPATRPYHGGALDGPANGPAPEPWSVSAPIGLRFVDAEQAFVLPHTEEARQCHGCAGRGIVTCSPCGGDGRVTCSRCHGTGSVTQTRTVTRTDAQGQSTSHVETYSESCPTTETCGHCSGSGSVTCGLCQGARNLVHFVRLVVTWRDHRAECVLEGTGMPDELVSDAEGLVVLLEEDDTVEPTPGTGTGAAGAFRDAPMRIAPEVDRAANGLIAEHGGPRAGGRLLRQRLTVRAVPVFEATYRWRGQEQTFWVYGTDRRVHAPGFPLSIARVTGAAVLGVALLALPLVAVYRAAGEAPPSPPDVAQPLPAVPAAVAVPPPPVFRLPDPPLGVEAAVDAGAGMGTGTGMGTGAGTGRVMGTDAGGIRTRGHRGR